MWFTNLKKVIVKITALTEQNKGASFLCAASTLIWFCICLFSFKVPPGGTNFLVLTRNTTAKLKCLY